MHNYILMFLLCNIPSLGGAWGGLSYMFNVPSLQTSPPLEGLGEVCLICSFCSLFANIPSFGGAWGCLSLGEVCLLGRSVSWGGLSIKNNYL